MEIYSSSDGDRNMKQASNREIQERGNFLMSMSQMSEVNTEA